MLSYISVRLWTQNIDAAPPRPFFSWSERLADAKPVVDDINSDSNGIAIAKKKNVQSPVPSPQNSPRSIAMQPTTSIATQPTTLSIEPRPECFLAERTLHRPRSRANSSKKYQIGGEVKEEEDINEAGFWPDWLMKLFRIQKNKHHTSMRDSESFRVPPKAQARALRRKSSSDSTLSMARFVREELEARVQASKLIKPTNIKPMPPQKNKNGKVLCGMQKAKSCSTIVLDSTVEADDDKHQSSRKRRCPLVSLIESDHKEFNTNDTDSLSSRRVVVGDGSYISMDFGSSCSTESQDILDMNISNSSSLPSSRRYSVDAQLSHSINSSRRNSQLSCRSPED